MTTFIFAPAILDPGAIHRIVKIGMGQTQLLKTTLNHQTPDENEVIIPLTLARKYLEEGMKCYPKHVYDPLITQVPIDEVPGITHSARALVGEFKLRNL
jgi:hypothetical protein